MPNLKVSDYPQLNAILWDIHSKTVSKKVAFEIYERRWDFVDKNALTEKEKCLIANLANLYGNGILMVRR